SNELVPSPGVERVIVLVLDLKNTIATKPADVAHALVERAELRIPPFVRGDVAVFAIRGARLFRVADVIREEEIGLRRRLADQRQERPHHQPGLVVRAEDDRQFPGHDDVAAPEKGRASARSIASIVLRPPSPAAWLRN